MQCVSMAGTDTAASRDGAFRRPPVPRVRRQPDSILSRRPEVQRLFFYRELQLGEPFTRTVVRVSSVLFLVSCVLSCATRFPLIKVYDTNTLTFGLW